MSLFDSIVETASEKVGLSGNQAGGLLSALLGLITTGGFNGFLDRFRNAGLGDLVDSWVTTGDNTPLSNEQVESALGQETIASVADQAGVDRTTATSAMSAMIPPIVDKLTPDGELPDESSLLSRIGGYLTGIGGAVTGGIGAAGSKAGGVADKVGDVAGATYDKSKEIIGGGADAVGSAAGAVGDKVSGAMSGVGDALDGDGDSSSILKWLIPLLLLGLLVIISFMFCGRSTPTTPTNANVNTTKGNVAANTTTTAKTVDSSFKIEAKDGKYVVSGVVPDQKTLDEIKTKLDAQFGAGNVDYGALKVDTNAKPFAAGWWDNFAKMLPSLKDWKNGSLAFIGNAIQTTGELPKAAIDQIKSLFSGWTLPVSITGAETAAKQANEEALKELNKAASIEEVIKALNVSIINFKSGSSEIPPDAKPILEKAAEVLKKQSEGTMIEIGGYTDSDGNDDANLKLSQARADSVKKALVGLGVKDSMLTAKGYGEADPVAPNDTPDNKFKNRRIAYKTRSGNAPTATTTTNTNTTKANTNAAK